MSNQLFTGLLALVITSGSGISMAAKVENRRQTRETSRRVAFAEVSILLDGTIGIDEIRALPQAPDGLVRELSDPARVVVQLPTMVVDRLISDRSDVRTLRSFLLVDGAGGDGTPVARAACYGTNAYYQNPTNVSIPDYFDLNWGWVYSVNYVLDAPGSAAVTCIDVHYEIRHEWVENLDIDLTDESLTHEYHLWGPAEGWGADISETVTGITMFNGELVSQAWVLWAIDYVPNDVGYIDYWWIKVYYDGSEPPDSCEPDNLPAQATSVSCGQTQSHSVHEDGDVDWFRIDLQIGQKLSVETSNLSGTFPDTVLELYDNECGFFHFDDDSGVGSGSQLWWMAMYTGAHYIKARTDGGAPAYCDDRGGGPALCTYDITFTGCLPPPAPGNPSPSDGAGHASPNTDLCWSTAGQRPIPPPLDAEYDVYFGSCDDDIEFVGTTSQTCWAPQPHEPDTEYCWQLTTRDGCGQTTGQVWSFTTAVWADYDFDGDVDLTDSAHFVGCLNGPDRPPAQPGCDNADFDGDGHVDLGDSAKFLGAFTWE